MTTPTASSTSDQQVEEVLANFVELVSAWSSPRVQGQIARQTGLDINEGDVRTLHTLGRIGGSVRPAQLALDLHLSRPTMSKSLARLLAAGLVERTAVAGDRRATDISLTPSGARAYQGLIDAGTAMVRDALRLAPGIDTNSIVQFTRALGATI
ncbi:MarR family winged helix-turn-helix transcriptional regulator [Leucobacter salsicius]|uniref:MarR family winged helix-turn-helix transcriptional regulator n=1 Tax=Leucobacter salsicius TaxID=664638 RepID=UPI00034DABE7|nr:MarR family transcriptional regulator [Leucobacter salsicius]